MLWAASGWRLWHARRQPHGGAAQERQAATEARVAERLGALARPHAVQPVEPGIAAPVTPIRPAPTVGRVAGEDPRARLWRDASVALVLIAGLALAGSAGLLPDLLGRRPTGGPARSVVPLASASVGSGPTLPGASPSLPFTGRSTPTPGPSATSGGQGTSSSPPARSPASPTPPR